MYYTRLVSSSYKANQEVVYYTLSKDLLLSFSTVLTYDDALPFDLQENTGGN